MNPNMMGNRWVGDFRSQLASMSATDRARALDAMRRWMTSGGRVMSSRA
jgi:hypothetical protein